MIQRIPLSNQHVLAEVLPGLGASLSKFGIRGRDGSVTDVFRPAPMDEPQLSDVSMFPMGMCGRIPNRTFRFAGATHVIEHPADPQSALHGLVRRFPFEVISSSEEKIELLLQFTSGMGGYTWLSNFDASITYFLRGPELHGMFRVRNTGSSDLPAWIGFHPMVLKRKSPVQVRYTAKGYFPFDPETLVPAGGSVALPVELNRSKFGDMPAAWDHCLCGWSGDAEMRWADENLRLVYGRQDAHSNCLQAWGGGDRNVHAFEAQTGVANAAQVDADGHADSGLIVVPPNEFFEIHHYWSLLPIQA